jgi:hypothetical protein
MILPIVGYGGHRKGTYAGNIYAKNFRDTALIAQKNLRAVKSLKQ